MTIDRSQRAKPSRDTGPVGKLAAKNASDENVRLLGVVTEQASALHEFHQRQAIRDRLASIGALAAGLGHDMNNVLLPMRAHLEAARAMVMTSAVREHMDAVQKSVTYLQQLADGLHYLVLDPEDEGISEASTDLYAWWEQAGPLLSKAVSNEVEFTVNIPTGLPCVRLSAHGLTQVMLNLIVNAGEAIAVSQKGELQQAGQVHLTAEMTENGELVRLDVIDNGRGMSEEVQRNAFSMFYTTKPRELGTGLGLSLVARVIEHAHGTVHVQSQVGKGTTVSVFLPIAASGLNKPVRPAFAVMLKDERARDLVHYLIEGAGASVTPESQPDIASIWVLDPIKENLDRAMTWRAHWPTGAILLLGKPVRGTIRGWHALNPVIIENPDDLNAIRDAVERAIHGS